MKTVLIVGAGATLSEVNRKSLKKTPPLDSGFFNHCKRLEYRMKSITDYLLKNYDIDPTRVEYDSLEKIMAIIYADINNPLLQDKAIPTFRNLIKLFNRRIAESTNDLNITVKSNLFRLIAKKIKSGVLPKDISIITFNQDIQIEKTLEKLQNTRKYSKHGTVFSFPQCYSIEGATDRLSIAPTGHEVFQENESDDIGIPVYKLHGSLNWFSTHTSKFISKKSILSKTKKLKITPRQKIPIEMRFNTGKRTIHTFPLIIPPVNHKSAIIHNDLYPVWKEAEAKLKMADEIIVFGYSCPSSDFESANLIRRAANTAQSFVVIDPSPVTFQRYVELIRLDYLSFFRSCKAYLEKG